MSYPKRPEAPRGDRGASSWAQRINDGTGEWLTAWARLMSVTWSLAASGALLGLIWWPSWGWAGTLATCVAAGAMHAWAGFVWLANPEWRDGDGEAD